MSDRDNQPSRAKPSHAERDSASSAPSGAHIPRAADQKDEGESKDGDAAASRPRGTTADPDRTL